MRVWQSSWQPRPGGAAAAAPSNTAVYMKKVQPAHTVAGAASGSAKAAAAGTRLSIRHARAHTLCTSRNVSVMHGFAQFALLRMEGAAGANIARAGSSMGGGVHKRPKLSGGRICQVR